MSAFRSAPSVLRAPRTNFAVDVVACGKGGLGSGPGPKKRPQRKKWVYPSYVRTDKAKKQFRKDARDERRIQRLKNLGFHECLICHEIILRQSSDKGDQEVQCRRPCSAYFHKSCADSWLDGVSSCPACKINPMFKGGPTEAPNAVAFRNSTNQVWEGDNVEVGATEYSDSSDDDMTTVQCDICGDEIEVEELEDAYNEGWQMDDDGEWECADCKERIDEEEAREEHPKLLIQAVTSYLDSYTVEGLDYIYVQSPRGVEVKFYADELKSILKALRIYKRSEASRITVTDDSGRQRSYTRRELYNILSDDETDHIRDWFDMQ